MGRHEGFFAARLICASVAAVVVSHAVRVAAQANAGPPSAPAGSTAVPSSRSAGGASAQSDPRVAQPAASTVPAQPAPHRSSSSSLSDTGLGILGMSYLTSLGIGLGYLVAVYPFQYAIAKTDAEPALLWLMVPVAGPFVGITRKHMRGETALQVIYAIDGAVQATGLVLWSVGLFDSPEEQKPTSSLHLLPGAAGGLLGATLRYTTL